MNELQKKGRAILRRILGEEYYARRERNETAFNKDFRDLAEEYCFGKIWGRSALDQKTRSLILLGTLVALDKPNEVKIHIVGAINNGCSINEIKEVFLQSVIYCGIPSGVMAFKVAEEVFKELNIEY